MKIIIIGGVAGGATTAARIRRVDETAEIILLEKGKYISYANCGLPYYIGGVIEERDKLFRANARSLLYTLPCRCTLQKTKRFLLTGKERQ